MPATPARRAIAQAEKREALLNASFELFRTRGLADTTVEEITQAAGVAKGTFYLYFDTKDDLVDQLRLEFAGQIESFFAAANPPEAAAQWPGFLSTLVGSAIDEFIDQRDLHDLISAIPHAHDAGPLADTMERAHRNVVRILEAGNRSGALDVPDASASAWLMLDVIHAAGDRSSIDQANASRYRQGAVRAVQRWLLK